MMKKNKAGIIIDISQSKFYLDGHSIVNGFIDSKGIYIYIQEHLTKIDLEFV